jgi:DNA-binding transcriptional LysR family regulator
MNLLSSLRYLVALQEHRHFGRAAKACHVTQPALSNALRALEAEFGVAIVRRDRSFVGFTLEGERVLASAQRMMHEHAFLQEALRGDAQTPTGTLRMGAVPTAVPIAARFAAQLQAKHPGIVPVVLSMSSLMLEQGLQNLSLDLALGYTDRMDLAAGRLTALPQYVEHYFLVRRALHAHADGMQMGEATTWQAAAALPLCLLTQDMHNRTIVDAAFASVGEVPQPALETNSILTMALSVAVGAVSSVLPGALVSVVRNYRELEALPLHSPHIQTPIGLMSHASVRPTRALEAALVLAQDQAWLQHASAHSGLLKS